MSICIVQIALSMIFRPVLNLPTTVAVEKVTNSGLLQRKEEKISFKFLPPDKSAAVVNAIKTINADLTPHAKTNGRLTIDADSIIAAIEKEVPPDYKTDAFVPLFQRRKPDSESTTNRPKLGNNFKTYFRSTHHQPILDDPECYYIIRKLFYLCLLNLFLFVYSKFG